VVFQTANRVLVVSVVVLVVIEFVVAAPPRVRLQPPNLYPLREVETLLASDSVERESESADTLVEVSVVGTDVARVLPSKTMVGRSAVEALTEVGTAVRPARANRPVRTRAVVFLDSDINLELRTVAIRFPSMLRFLVAKSNFRPTTIVSWVPTGCE
jgi:hypothetical protein